MALEIEISESTCGTCRVRLSGALDNEACDQFAGAVESALADTDIRALYLEVHDLKYISSMGLGAIVKARKAIEAKGGVLRIIGAMAQILKVFELVGMLPKDTVFANRQEADIYVAMVQASVPGGGADAD